ncbi:MAG: PEP-CTERM sorting domain-containing protein [Planctomycetota bacterium]
MRSIIACPLVAAAAAVSQVSAARVSFDPSVAVVSPGETAEFVMSITSADLPAFHGVDILFLDESATAWEPTILDLSFTYAPSFVESATSPPTPPNVYCFFGTCGTKVGGFNSNAWTVPDELPLLIGTLAVDTADLEPGTYEIYVDSAWEQEFIGGTATKLTYGLVTEHIYGSATLIVPEPATISPLALAAVCVIRRRRIPGHPGAPGRHRVVPQWRCSPAP